MSHDGDTAEKDKEGGGQGKGSRQDDQVTGKSNEQQGEDEAEVSEADAGAEEHEDVTVEPFEKTDQHLPEGETLDLPENMDIEGDSQQKSDGDSLDELEEFDNQEDGSSDHCENDGVANDDVVGEDLADDFVSEAGDEEVQRREDNDRTVGQEDELDNIRSDEDAQDPERLLDSKAEDANAAEDALTSEVRGGPTATETQDGQFVEDSMSMSAENDQGTTSRSKTSTTEIMRESGTNGEGKRGGSDDERGGSNGERGGSDGERGRGDDERQDKEVQAFKRLGDTLESWYSQQRQIQQAREKPDQERADTDFKDTEFEHLPDDVARADTQALGTATQDQAIALDERNAVHMNDDETSKDEFANGDQEGVAEDEDVEMLDAEPSKAVDQPQSVEGPSKTFIGDAKSLANRDLGQIPQDADSESDLEEVDAKLSIVNLSHFSDDEQVRDEARTLWSKHEVNTRPLAAMLTEQALEHQAHHPLHCVVVQA